ncbi:response regulator [Nitrospirota bacterium]
MNKYKILIVEDDKDLRLSLRELLETQDYIVAEAEDGREAESILLNNSYDLILTDILMPEKDGLELIQEIMKADHPTKVIAVSGGGMVVHDYFLKEAKKYPAVKACLMKPFSAEELFETVKRILVS